MSHNDNDNDHSHGIDSDRTEGSLKKVAGNVKEGVGSLLGDEKLKREGQAEQVEGKAQNAWGSAKDKAREILDDDKRD